MNKQELKLEIESVINWIREYVKKGKAKGVVIGNSGGKDSAVAIGLATKALGKQSVLTIAMPCESKKEDLEDAYFVARKFEVPLIEVDLSSEYNLLNKKIESQLRKELSKEAKINTKPRLRMTTLYMIAQSLDYFVMGTGNLCERMVGYTTKWGDNSSDFNPLGNFTVEEVLQIGKLLEVPKQILSKEPSDGMSNQTDEEKLGVYYQEISQYCLTGKINKQTKEKIDSYYRKAKHKIEPIPIYPIKNRINYIEKMNQ